MVRDLVIFLSQNVTKEDDKIVICHIVSRKIDTISSSDSLHVSIE
jgi:hypothetical protein